MILGCRKQRASWPRLTCEVALTKEAVDVALGPPSAMVADLECWEAADVLPNTNVGEAAAAAAQGNAGDDDWKECDGVAAGGVGGAAGGAVAATPVLPKMYPVGYGNKDSQTSETDRFRKRTRGRSVETLAEEDCEG